MKALLSVVVCLLGHARSPDLQATYAEVQSLKGITAVSVAVDILNERSNDVDLLSSARDKIVSALATHHVPIVRYNAFANLPVRKGFKQAGQTGDLAIDVNLIPSGESYIYAVEFHVTTDGKTAISNHVATCLLFSRMSFGVCAKSDLGRVLRQEIGEQSETFCSRWAKGH